MWDVERDDTIATLRQTRPPANHLSVEGLRELDVLLRTIDADDAVKVIVFASGVPGVFTGQGDLDDIAAAARGEIRPDTLDLWTLTLLRLEDTRQPTVAAINGVARGGGLELALACTFRVASEHATFTQHEVSRGAMPGAGGTQRLTAIVGPARAAELVLFAREVDAHQAKGIGLVHEVLPADGFEAAVREWAQPLVDAPPAAMTAAKRALVEGQRLGRRDGLELERRLFEGLIASDDFPPTPHVNDREDDR